ncbi:transposase [Bradyrhizobium ivorense]|uniref:transposase n=1 Tax=Bradyrhizobium ivorense TaxID=2511166 RepID=UPI00155A09F5
MPISLRLCWWHTGCICQATGANDRVRRRKAGVAEEVGFKTKPEVALEQLLWAYDSGLPRGFVLLDAGSGNNGELCTEITKLG